MVLTIIEEQSRMNQNRGQMNNQYRDKFVGREQEIREIEDMIQHYNFHESYVLNLCGQGGRRRSKRIADRIS